MAELPFVSVVIPTRNRPEAIARCLASLARVDYPRGRYEVIVVDDGSDRPLDEIVVPHRRHLSLRLLRRPNGGPGAARNTGVAAARGELIAFTDDDCIVHRRWLREIARALVRHPDALVGGPVVNLLRHNPFAEASQQLVSFLYGHFNTRPMHARFFTGNNISVRRDRLLAAGGFDERFSRGAAEDRELCDRWYRSGAPSLACRRALIGHRHSLTARRFVRQHWNYGRGAWVYRRKVAACARDKVRVEPPRFYLDLMRYPFGQRGSLAWRLAICALFLVSQIANAAGFFTARAEAKFSRR